MKRFLALLLALAMTLALVACGEKKDDTKTDGAGDGEKTYKVAMICDSSINDGGWGAACYNAMVKAAEDKGWTYDVTDSISQDQYYETIVAFCNLGYDMIYAPGNQYTDAVLQAAEEYPDIAFALLNGAESTPEKAANGNVASLLPNAEQIGWIAGALAGLMTESGKLGFIGGMELDTTKGKIAGFEAAAKYVGEQEGKTVELLAVPYANSFSDAPKGKEFATELISQGADVFFGDASAVDSGAREAIDAANEKAGAIKIYDIGQPADILGQNPCIICSQVTDNAAMIGVCMEAVVAGTFGGNTIFGTLENGALSAGAINTELVPADKVEKVEELLQAGRDVLVLAFSSGLSATFQSSKLAVEELSEKYPERKLYTVDTLCASLGQGMLVDLTVQEKRQGKTLDEAAAFAGVLSYEEAFRFVLLRAESMAWQSGRHPGGMAAALKLAPEVVEEICSRFSEVWPVNYNCPGQVSCAGSAAEIDDFCAAVRQAGGRAVKLPVSGAFHTPYMAQVAPVLRAALDGADVSAPAIPLYANRTASPYPVDRAGILDCMTLQVCSPVRWESTLHAMWTAGITTFVEVGAGHTLTGFVSRTLPEARALTVNDIPSFEAVCRELTE